MGSALMVKAELQEFWESEFGNPLPVADQLKWRFDSRWFRIHYLPESKRYPETEAEYLEINKRFRVLLTRLLQNQSNLIVVTSVDSSSDTPSIDGIGENEEFWRSDRFAEDDDESEPSYLHSYTSVLGLNSPQLDKLFRRIAHEEVHNVMLISIPANFIFHPYDGGADVIVANCDRRDRYETEFRDWTSPRPDRL